MRGTQEQQEQNALYMQWWMPRATSGDRGVLCLDRRKALANQALSSTDGPPLPTLPFLEPQPCGDRRGFRAVAKAWTKLENFGQSARCLRAHPRRLQGAGLRRRACVCESFASNVLHYFHYPSNQATAHFCTAHVLCGFEPVG